MKLTSEGKVVLEMDEAKLQAAAEDPVMWRFEMLKASIVNKELNKRLCQDHIELKENQRELRSLIVKALGYLTAILAIVGGASYVLGAT